MFTFSRGTLAPHLVPVAGEPFVYTEFSGQPQTFLTHAQLVYELAAAGFALDEAIPLAEHNLPPPGTVHALQTPVILEGAFRFTGRTHRR